VPYVYAALLDVLGYRDYLNEDRKNGTLLFKNHLQKAFACFSEVNSAIYQHEAISDTIIITCNRRDDFPNFLEVLKKVSLSFLKQNLFIRGGVAYSQHFKSSNITYSHAVSLAYELEAKKAKFPRIVIDHNILDMFDTPEDTKILSAILKSELICQQNGIYFLNILDKKNWKTVHTYAKKIYKSDSQNILSDEEKFSKHCWFENYLFSSKYVDHRVSRYIPPIEVSQKLEIKTSQIEANALLRILRDINNR
jgi:hypothetical protein